MSYKKTSKERLIEIVKEKDKLIQKAIAILLELVYENNGIFQEESHGFRRNKSCHTALKDIKCKWTDVPFYLQMGLAHVFDDKNRNILINILKKKIRILKL